MINAMIIDAKYLFDAGFGSFPGPSCPRARPALDPACGRSSREGRFACRSVGRQQRIRRASGDDLVGQGGNPVQHAGIQVKKIVNVYDFYWSVSATRFGRYNCLV